ncbi:hypothetical protein [Priestia megaterium]|uniref:hypothetical protein n=1 Tax=Priestia megaterium TaxID=1404 RepID=UPI000BFBFE61|nr:hypothetical protein [Priestia megaterium]PGQ88227.1 hypothetical protein COA18_04690 [Priestia megaterium]
MFLQELEKFPLGSIIESEYFYLSGRGYSGSSQYVVPQIKELAEETWSSAVRLMKENDARAALMRNEHDIYSMTKKEFLKQVFDGKIKVHHENEVYEDSVRYEVNRFLQSRSMSFTDYSGGIWNSPIGCEVW